MNASNWRHVGYGVAIMLVVALILAPFSGTVAIWAGAFAGGTWFIGREHAQREVDLARADGVPVQELYWWEGFRGWDKDRMLDALAPCAANFILAVVLSLVLL